MVPYIWKAAIIIPLPKKVSIYLKNNNQPVSLTCILCHVFKKLIRNHILNFIKYINCNEHDFVNGKSILSNIYIYNLNHHHHHHHHHHVPPAQISLTLSHHPSLLSIAPSRSSRLHPVLAQSCCFSVLAGCPVFTRPCDKVHRSMLLMSSSLLLQQCPTCLVRLTWIVLVMGGRWPYSCCFVGCCLQDLFNIAHSILV